MHGGKNLMTQPTRYRYATPFGMFSIELSESGLWRVRHGRRELNESGTPEDALGGLLQNETAWPGGPRNSQLGLPLDLEDWARSMRRPR